MGGEGLLIPRIISWFPKQCPHLVSCWNITAPSGAESSWIWLSSVAMNARQGEAEVSCVCWMVGWKRRARRTTGIWEHHPLQKQLRTCAACSVLPSPVDYFQLSLPNPGTTMYWTKPGLSSPGNTRKALGWGGNPRDPPCRWERTCMMSSNNQMKKSSRCSRNIPGIWRCWPAGYGVASPLHTSVLPYIPVLTPPPEQSPGGPGHRSNPSACASKKHSAWQNQL